MEARLFKLKKFSSLWVKNGYLINVISTIKLLHIKVSEKITLTISSSLAFNAVTSLAFSANISSSLFKSSLAWKGNQISDQKSKEPKSSKDHSPMQYNTNNM